MSSQVQCQGVKAGPVDLDRQIAPVRSSPSHHVEEDDPAGGVRRLVVAMDRQTRSHLNLDLLPLGLDNWSGQQQ